MVEADRIGWVDAARGATIVLIVALHTQGALATLGADHPALDSVNVALATVRLPTFFLISGLFAAAALEAPARAFVRRRPALFGYLYLLWSAILIATVTVLALATGKPVGDAAGGALHDALFADGVLWYFAALAVFFTVARLTRRLPVAAQFAGALVLAVVAATDVLPIPSWGVDHMLSSYVWFLAGWHGRARAEAFAARATPVRCLALAGGWLAGGALLRLADPSGRALVALLPLVAVPLAISLAAVVTRRFDVARLRTLGRHTLPVYVLHPVVIAVLVAGLGALTPRPLADLPLPVQALLVLVGLVAVTAASWGAWRALHRVTWLFALPAPRVPVPAAVGNVRMSERSEGPA